MDDIIWSSNETRNYLSGLDDEAKSNALVDRGYDSYMLSGADLDSVISDDDYMWQDDSDRFRSEILPEINKQTMDGIVLMVGDMNKATYADDLPGGDINPQVDDVDLIDDGEGVSWIGHSKFGNDTVCKLYAIPEDRISEFCETCLTDAMDFEEYMESDDLLSGVLSQIDLDYINEYCDFTKVPESCDRIILGQTNESLHESLQLNEVKAKDPEGLKAELEEIIPLADEYGYSYFTAMPFTSYDKDPISLEYNYPNFFKVCKAFFKETGLLEDPGDTDELDDLWYGDVDQNDWDTIVKVAKVISENPGKNKEFKKAHKDRPIDNTVRSHNNEPEEKPVKKNRTKIEPSVLPNKDYDESLKEDWKDVILTSMGVKSPDLTNRKNQTEAKRLLGDRYSQLTSGMNGDTEDFDAWVVNNSGKLGNIRSLGKSYLLDKFEKENKENTANNSAKNLTDDQYSEYKKWRDEMDKSYKANEIKRYRQSLSNGEKFEKSDRPEYGIDDWLEWKDNQNSSATVNNENSTSNHTSNDSTTSDNTQKSGSNADAAMNFTRNNSDSVMNFTKNNADSAMDFTRNNNDTDKNSNSNYSVDDQLKYLQNMWANDEAVQKGTKEVNDLTDAYKSDISDFTKDESLTEDSSDMNDYDNPEEWPWGNPFK